MTRHTIARRSRWRRAQTIWRRLRPTICERIADAGPVSNTYLSTTCIPNARRACVARVREVSVRAARRAARAAGAAQDRPCPEAGPQCSLETLARGEGRGAQ